MNRRDLIRLLAAAAMIVLAVALIAGIDHKQDDEETRIVRDAIRNAALSCYAVEGGYPDRVEYLRQYYQLAYDEDRYMVTYEYVGANLMPDIYVTKIGAE